MRCLILLSLAAPLFAQTWTNTGASTLQSVCPPNNYNLGVTVNGVTQTAYPFSTDCYGVIHSGSGAAIDTLRNRMLIWGGGHGGSSGNELYAVDHLTTIPQFTRLNNPSVFASNSFSNSFSDLVISAMDSTIVSSASYVFTTQQDAGEYLQINGGSGCTSHNYTIVSVTAGSAKLNGSAGTPSSTCVWTEFGEFYPSDGLPTPRQTGGGLVYIPQSVTACGVTGDKYFAWSGSGDLPPSGPSRMLWLLDAATLTWCNMYPEQTAGGFDTTQGFPPTGDGTCAWNANDNRVWCAWDGAYTLLAYSPSANKWTQIINHNHLCVSTCFDYIWSTSAIDPVNQVFWVIGNRSVDANFQMWSVNINPSSGSYLTITDHSSTQTGCSSGTWTTNGSMEQTVPGSTTTGLNVPSPGWAYDSLTGHFLGYPWDGETLYDYNPSTDTCTQTTYGGTVDYSQATIDHGGIFGRLGFFPALNEVVVVNFAGNPAYLLNLGGGSTTSGNVSINGAIKIQ